MCGSLSVRRRAICQRPKTSFRELFLMEARRKPYTWALSLDRRQGSMRARITSMQISGAWRSRFVSRSPVARKKRVHAPAQHASDLGDRNRELVRISLSRPPRRERRNLRHGEDDGGASHASVRNVGAREESRQRQDRRRADHRPRSVRRRTHPRSFARRGRVDRDDRTGNGESEDHRDRGEVCRRNRGRPPLRGSHSDSVPLHLRFHHHLRSKHPGNLPCR